MVLARKIAFSTIYQTAGKIVAVVLGLVQVFLLTRYLGEAGYGQYQTVTAFFGMAVVFAEFGLHITNVTNISKPGANASKILSNAFSMRVVSSVLIFITAVVLGFFVIPFEPVIKIGIVFASLAFAFLSINQVFVGVFQKFFVNYMLVFGEVVAKIIVIIAIVILMRLNAGVVAILASLNIAFAAHLALTMFIAYKYIPFSFDFDINLWKKLLKESWPIAFAGVLNLVYFRMDTIILSVYQGSVDVGVYSVPYKILEVLIAFPALFAGLLLPILSTSVHQNITRFKIIIQESFNVLVFVALLVIVETYLYADNIISLIAGDGFNDSAAVLKLLILAIAFLFIGSLFGHAVPALNLQKKMVAGYALAAISGLVLYFWLIPIFSYYGAAVGTIVTEIIAAFYAGFLVLRKIKYRLQILPLVKALIAATIAYTTAIYLFEYINWYWMIEALLLAVFYLLLLYYSGAIDKNNLKLLLPSYKKNS